MIDPIVKMLGSGWEWLAGVSWGAVCVRLLLSILCAGVLGIERATKRHAAGLRTYILVCMGSCIAMYTNQFIYEAFATGDVARMANGVVGGLGFLGAGTILTTNHNRIRGLTTASGLWACGCIGLALGIGFYSLAVVGTVLVSGCLVILPRFESVFVNSATYFDVHVEIREMNNLEKLLNFIRQRGYQICSVAFDSTFNGSGLACYAFTLQSLNPHHKRRQQDALITELRDLPFVNYAGKDY